MVVRAMYGQQFSIEERHGAQKEARLELYEKRKDQRLKHYVEYKSKIGR